MMDPIAAIGLAGSIVQFVDFSWKIFSETKDFYESSTGTTAGNDVLESISRDLIQLNDALTAPSNAGAIPDGMRDLASQCKGVAQELFEVLDKIKVIGPRRKWKSFVKALQSVWKAEQIEKLVKRMERLRNEMQLRLQLMLSEQNSELHAMLTNLAAENRRLEIDGTWQLESQLKGVLHALSQLQSEAKAHKTNRQDRSEAIKKTVTTDATTVTRSSDDMRDLFNKLSSLAKEVGSTASDQMLLSSLYFNSIKERRANIAFSHEQTFNWIWDPSSRIEFETWMRSENGIYWIMGKAGSGKSTLMNFILNHPQTLEALTSWAGTKKLVTASFFFCSVVTTLHKSQEGLFRSLLYEILRLCPDLVRIICASKLATFRPFGKEIEPWTQQELRQAIEQLKEQKDVRARFCFFIDGLDEYDGDPDHIVDLLESLRSWPDIKLCVSSRPWNEFVDAFGRPSDPHLALEDLTREDIQIYIWHTLENNSHFVKLKAKDPRTQDLVQEIVDKARGVFLWVVLVVRSLLNGLRNADRIYDLQRRLRQFPDTLEKYFGHIVASIDSIYREQTAQSFVFAITAAEPLSLLTYSFLDEENLDAMATAQANPSIAKEISSRQDDMRRRLNGRCKGLLEVVSGGAHEDSYANHIQLPKVDFLHRTVRDYLLKKEMQNMLRENLSPGFEPQMLLCKAFLAQLKALDYHALKGNSSVPKEILEDLTFYARGLELESGVPQITLLDEVSIFVSRQATCFGLNEGDCGFLEFLVNRELHLYIKETLKRRPPLAQLNRSALLRSALDLQTTKYSVPRYDPEMIDLLLEHGASPDMVWGDFVQVIYKHASQDALIDRKSLRPVEDTVPKVIESLLRHGANPKQRVVIGHKTMAAPEPTGRASDLHKRSFVQVQTASAQEVFIELLGQEKAASLFSKAQAQQKPILSRLVAWFSGSED